MKILQFFLLIQLYLFSSNCQEQQDFDEEFFQTLENYDRELDMNRKIHYKIDSKDRNIFMQFQFTIPENYDYEKERIMILTRPDDYRSDPDIFIHDQVTEPTEQLIMSPEYKDYFCYHYGPDFCFIPKEYLVPGKQLNIFVYIQFGPCNFNMMVYTMQKQVQQFSFNNEYIISLKDNDNDYQESLSTYFSIKLPTVQENPNYNFFTISALHENPIYGYSMNSEQNDHDMHLMFSIGKDVDPQTNNQSTGSGIFVIENGLVFKINKKSQFWKPGEIYNFVITSQDKDQIRIIPRIGNSDQVIELKFDEYFEVHNRKLPEVLFSDEKQTFKIKYFSHIYNLQSVQDQKFSTIIQLHQTFGNSQLYIDCQDNHLDYINSEFLIQGQGTNAIMISSEELNENCEDLFITIVSPNYVSAFTLEIGFKPEDLSNDTILPIAPGITEYGYLKSDELSAYIFELRRDQPERVKIVLNALQGNTDLYLRKCDKNDNCMISADLINPQNFKNDKQFLHYSQSEGNDIISFEHSEATCYNTDDMESNQNEKYNKETLRPYCLYAIFVYNKEYHEDESVNEALKYELTLTLQKQTKFLKENQIIFDEVLVNQYNYYFFDIGSYEDIEEIDFIITPVSGDPNILVSRNQKQPTYSNSYIGYAWKNYVAFNSTDWGNDQQITTFYVGIHGFTESRYGITVQIHRKDEETNNLVTAFSLINGIYMNSLLRKNKDYVMFEFPVTKINNLVQLQLLNVDNQFITNLIIYGQPITKENVEIRSLDLKEYPYKSQTGVMQIDRSYEKNAEMHQGYRFIVQRINKEKKQKVYFKLLAQSLDQFIEIIPGAERQLIIYKAQEYNQQKELYRAVMFKFKVDLDLDDQIHLSLKSEVYRNAFYAQFFAIKENALIAFRRTNENFEIENVKNKYFSAFILFDQNQLKNMCQGQNKNNCYIQGLLKTFGEDSIFHDDYNVKANLLLVKINKEKNQKANLIKLEKNKNLEIPIFTYQKKSPTFYPMYYQILDKEQGIFFDFQGSDIDSQINYHFIDSLDNINNEIYYNNLFEDKFSDQISQYMHYHKEFTSSEIKKNCKDKKVCYLFLCVLSNAFNQYLSVQIGENIMDLSYQMNQFIKGNVLKEENKYFKVHLQYQTEYIRFTLNMINSGDADIIVYYSENDDTYRPIINYNNKNVKLCEEAKLIENSGNFQCKVSENTNKNDEVEFKPAYKGYYIIGIVGAEQGDNLFDLHWSSNTLREIQEGISQKYQAPYNKQSHYFFTIKEQVNQNYMMLFSSQDPIIFNLKIKIFVCDDPKSWLLSENMFCQSQFLTQQFDFNLKDLSIQVNAQEMCKNVIGPDCHLVFEFQSFSNNKQDLNFEAILVKQVMGYSQMILKPNLYQQNKIFMGETHNFQVLFYDPDNFKTHFLNINSIYGELNIDIKPKTLKLNKIMGQENQLWAKITEHTIKNDKQLQNQNQNKNQLSYVNISVSGCQDEIGCEYGMGISVEGQTFKLSPGVAYTGIAYLDQSQKFTTQLDEFIDKTKNHYLTISTFIDWKIDIEQNYYLNIIVIDQYDVQYEQSQQFYLKQGQHSNIINLKNSNPIVQIELKSQKGNTGSQKVKIQEIDFSIIMQNGSFQELFVQEQYMFSQDLYPVKQKNVRETSDIYVINARQDGFIVVDINQCYLQFGLKNSNTYEDLIKSFKSVDYDTIYPNQKIIKIEKNQQQFIAVDVKDRKDKQFEFLSPEDLYDSQVQQALDDYKNTIETANSGVYKIKAYYFKEMVESLNKKLLPQNIMKAGTKGLIQVIQVNDDYVILWDDIQIQKMEETENVRKNIGMSTGNSSSIWAKILFSNKNLESHINLQMCGNSFNIQSQQEQNNFTQKSFLLENIDKNFQLQNDAQLLNLQKNQHYSYRIPQKVIHDTFYNDEKIYLSITLIVPPNAYYNLPLENFYNVEVQYTPKVVRFANIQKYDISNFQDLYSTFSFRDLFYIIIMIAMSILILMLVYYCVRRCFLKIKGNQQEESQMRIYGASDNIDIQNISNMD